ncbi:MAG: hypothetical protein OEV99_18190, partial [Nitrospira sp.]|nr:hypothetical protein [Nitrospira sp.]
MSLVLPRTLVEYLLLGPDGDRRQLQDSPILADVWLAFAKEPNTDKELLITPYRGKTAGSVSVQLDEYITNLADRLPTQRPPNIAYLQGVIAARLSFHDVLKVIVPLTDWWRRQFQKSDTSLYLNSKEGWEKISEVYETVERMIRHWSAPLEHERVDHSLSAFDRYAALAGLILWTSHETAGAKQNTEVPAQELWRTIKESLSDIRNGLQQALIDILTRFPLEDLKKRGGLIFQVSLNRDATMAVARSIPAVKADAARTLFTVNCSRLAWAVLDAGIQGDHPAFVAADGVSSRIKSAFDFTNIRRIVSLDSWKMMKENR